MNCCFLEKRQASLKAKPSQLPVNGITGHESDNPTYRALRPRESEWSLGRSNVRC
jgi:hypothetical protein